LFLPPSIQGEIEDCVRYQPYSIAKTWHRICTKFRAHIRSSICNIYRQHGETCLASGSTIILKLPLDSLDVVIEVHISWMHLSGCIWFYIAESRGISVSLVHESFWVISAVLNDVIWTEVFKALEEI